MRRSTRSIGLLGYTLSVDCSGSVLQLLGGGKGKKVKGKRIKWRALPLVQSWVSSSAVRVFFKRRSGLGVCPNFWVGIF